MRDRGLRHWIPSYLRETLERRRARSARRLRLTHIIFLVCDHFEPRHGIRHDDMATARVRAWHEGFRELQAECQKLYGLKPLHTWFYPPHHGADLLSSIARMAFDGLGEVELHYHHEGDTKESLRTALRQVLTRYHRAGLLLQLGSPPSTGFGFIHGDWALDNSAGGRYCGVNGELSLLKDFGCWADLTMPSANECQTRKINSIYYAQDDDRRSKSHDWGEDASVGETQRPGLLLIQGPLGFWKQGGMRLRMENASLTTANWGEPRRIDAWINCNIHVRGRPEWLFIKLHTHGAIERDFDALFGERARCMHKALAEQYNDGGQFRLHYVTARQAFNLIRAAEHGAEGDPRQFLDWEVGPPVTSRYWSNVEHDTRLCTPDRLGIDMLSPCEDATVALRYPGISQISGSIASLDITPGRAIIRVPREVLSSSPVTVHLAAGSSLRSLSGARVLSAGPERHFVVAASEEIRLELAEASEQASMGEVS